LVDPYRGVVTTETAPPPQLLVHLRPSDRHGLAVMAIAAGSTAIAVALSLRGGWLPWIVGQVLLGGALVQWFAILHECGHRTLFRGRSLNTIAGHLAGFMTIVPLRSWTKVHGRHHKWTGWQDLDPTTESLVPRPLGRFERLLINVCWRLWIPLFSTMYRLENYWKMKRLSSLFPGDADRSAIRRNIVLQIAAYAALVAIAGPSTIARAAALGIVLSLIAEDLLLLSQHTHVPQNVAGGETVSPVAAVDQEIFTRSLRLPRWASWLLLHFDAHELHHMYPFVPGYHLHRIPYRPTHEVGWWAWVRAAKRLAGVTLLFENRRSTGFEI
jgi:omega-6 fatty acid desaturase (delta-12 desaturase)